ncbi:MAG: hypothetical protein R3C44_23355 [Chloroflexota bacterium]
MACWRVVPLPLIRRIPELIAIRPCPPVVGLRRTCGPRRYVEPAPAGTADPALAAFAGTYQFRSRM